MDPFSGVSLPKAFQGIDLGMQSHRAKNRSKQQRFHVPSFPWRLYPTKIGRREAHVF
jgi:hypothetical protein